LLWFIAYFLVSNLRKDVLQKWDVAFDVIQSLASFVAAWAIGIAVHDKGYQFDRSAEAFQWANGAILAISFCSLAFFSSGDGWGELRGLNVLRIGGGVTAIVGLLVSRNDPLDLVHLVALAVTLLVLSVLLILFGRIRIKELPAELRDEQIALQARARAGTPGGTLVIEARRGVCRGRLACSHGFARSCCLSHSRSALNGNSKDGAPFMAWRYCCISTASRWPLGSQPVR